jgi:putative ABC transport system permease protein
MSTIANTLADSRASRLKGLVGVEGTLKLSEQVALALDTLRKNLLRSSLTVLGIVIGITTVIAVSSVINGLNDNVLGGIRELGSDTIIAYRFPWASLSRPPSEWFTRKELEAEWADDMAQLPHVKAASPSMRIFQPEFGVGTSDVRRGASRAKNVILQGNSPSITQIFDMKVIHGREFNVLDAEHRAPVVLLGYDTANLLFPDGAASAIGQEVTIDGQLFTVIGTMDKRRQGISGGSNPEDNIAVMPVTTLRKLYPNKKDYVIFAKNKPDDFALFTSDYFLDLWNKISGLIFILMFAIASVGLIVGGIGVMNIMLVSVTERTREIGVRKAIGARRSHILMQFLIEAVTLSALGGIIGVLLGSGLTMLLKYGIHMPAQLSIMWVLAALIACAMIGIGFGIYPAWKAARLDPVEALRYE